MDEKTQPVCMECGRNVIFLTAEKVAPHNCEVDRTLAMTGHTADIAAALDQWELERKALSEFADENNRLKIYSTLDGLIIAHAVQVALSLDMFSCNSATIRAVDEFNAAVAKRRKVQAEFDRR